MRRTVAMMAAAAVLVAGCGDPDYRYASDSQEGVSFRVPYSWTIFDRTEEEFSGRLDGGATAQALRVWVIDSNELADPRNPEQVDGDVPVGNAQIIATASGLSQNLSIASVRSVGLEFDPVNPATGLEDTWEVVTDQPLRSEGGVSGAVAIWNYRETTDDEWLSQAREVFVDPASNRVYLLDIYCSAACFEQHRDDIFDVLDSWRIDS
jgi:hypothetical protein